MEDPSSEDDDRQELEELRRTQAQKMVADRNWASCGGHSSEDGDRLGTGGTFGAVFFITCQMVMKMELGRSVVSAVCE